MDRRHVWRCTAGWVPAKRSSSGEVIMRSFGPSAPAACYLTGDRELGGQIQQHHSFARSEVLVCGFCGAAYRCGPVKVRGVTPLVAQPEGVAAEISPR